MLGLEQGPPCHHEEPADVGVAASAKSLGDIRPDRSGRPYELDAYRPADQRREMLNFVRHRVREFGCELIGAKVDMPARHPSVNPQNLVRAPLRAACCVLRAHA
jgi:hypothetical protein